MAAAAPLSPDQPVFYYDLGSPECYLAAERIMSALPVVPEWEPVLGSALGVSDSEPDRATIERLAAEWELQPVRWPPRWPPDTRTAMLAATYAKRVGRAVAFSLAAFRQAYAAGRDLADTDTVLIAAAACEMHPLAVLKGIELRSIREALASATERAHLAGISTLPAVGIGAQVFQADGAIEHAAVALQATA